MKTAIAVILSLLSSPASAQLWVSPTVPEPTVTQGAPSQSWVTYGTTIYGADGTTAQQIAYSNNICLKLAYIYLNRAEDKIRNVYWVHKQQSPVCLPTPMLSFVDLLFKSVR